MRRRLTRRCALTKRCAFTKHCAFTKLRDQFADVPVGGEVATNGMQLMDFRDAPWVYVDGRVLVGEDGEQMHEELIDRATGGDEDLTAELTGGRFGLETSVDTPFAAGYAVGDAAVVLNQSVQFVDTSTLTDALRGAGFARVFTVDNDADDVPALRVARRLRR